MSEYHFTAMAFCIASFFVCLSCVLYTLIQNRIDKLQKKLYLVMLVILILNVVSEFLIAAVSVMKIQTASKYFALSAGKYFYFVFHAALLPILCYYTMSITGRSFNFTKKRQILFFFPLIAVELLLITNPLHHFCYYYDGDAEYHREWGVTVLYVISALYIAFFVINVFRAWKAITAKRRAALLYFVSMVLAGIFVQLFFVNIRVELFAESVAFLGLLLTVEDEGDLLDADTGTYNRKALRIDLDNMLGNRQKFSVICVKIENPDIIRRLTGTSSTVVLSCMMQKEFSKYIPRYCIYQTSPDTFVLVIADSGVSAPDLLSKLCDRFGRCWQYRRAEFVLNAVLMLASVPGDIDNAEDVFNMADGTLPANHKKCLIGKEDLGYLLRRREIENAVQRGLNNRTFEVYYQPTVSADGMTVHGAEALVRLNDEKLGRLFPDEFIPVCEQIGLIGDLDDFVLGEGCKFIAGGVPDSLGVGSVNVNLSALQCINPDIAERLLHIVDESGVDRSRINFEITESVSPDDYEKMKSVVGKLKQYGFRVYMDDYGTGYSNVQALFSMDFDVVKIDKSILWGAEKSDFGRVILESSVQMLRRMRMGILVEGVETKEQARLLKDLGVDYFQGYLVSRPLPESDFVAFLKDYRASGDRDA